MTGLDKILQEIAEAAAKSAGEILEKARAEAAEQAAEVEASGREKAEAIQRQSEASVRDILRAGDSAVALQRRQRTLEAKQALIEDTLQAALATMRALPAEDYFTLLLRLAAANAQPGFGYMLLDETDAARLPIGYDLMLADALPEGCELQVMQAAAPIHGGFILQYGDIEENCSFAAILDARREEFSDAVRGILFA